MTHRKVHIFLFLFVLYISGFSQGNSSDSTIVSSKNEEGRKPVREPWQCNMLAEIQTTNSPVKGSFEFIIQHRFTTLNNGIKDLFGIYGGSNVRLGVFYGLTDKLMLGFGTEKDNLLQEFDVKYKILEQTRDGSMPVAVSFFGNATVNAHGPEYWGMDFKFIDRLSYLGQLIVSRKFSDAFSFEVAGSYIHINKVESVIVSDTLISSIVTMSKGIYQNDALGVSAGGRFKFYKEMSVIAEFDQGIFFKSIVSPQQKPKPNVALGLEIGTSTHCFQVFATSYTGLNPQQNYVGNQYDFTKATGIMIGFNITIRF